MPRPGGPDAFVLSVTACGYGPGLPWRRRRGLCVWDELWGNGYCDQSPGTLSCTPCADGFEPSESRFDCVPCRLGTAGTAGRCAPCQAGRTPSPGRDNCEGCPLGTASLSGVSCLDCGDGYYTDGIVCTRYIASQSVRRAAIYLDHRGGSRPGDYKGGSRPRRPQGRLTIPATARGAQGRRSVRLFFKKTVLINLRGAFFSTPKRGVSRTGYLLRTSRIHLHACTARASTHNCYPGRGRRYGKIRRLPRRGSRRGTTWAARSEARRAA